MYIFIFLYPMSRRYAVGVQALSKFVCVYATNSQFFNSFYLINHFSCIFEEDNLVFFNSEEFSEFNRTFLRKWKQGQLAYSVNLVHFWALSPSVWEIENISFNTSTFYLAGISSFHSPWNLASFVKSHRTCHWNRRFH